MNRQRERTRAAAAVVSRFEEKESRCVGEKVATDTCRLPAPSTASKWKKPDTGKERVRKRGGRYGREPSSARNEKRVFQRNPLFSLLQTRLQNRRSGTGFFSSGLSRLGIWFRRRRGRSGWVSNVGGPIRCDPPEEDSGSGDGLVAEDDLPHAEGLDRRLGSSSGSEKRWWASEAP